MILWTIFCHFLDPFWEPFWDPFSDQSFKDQKSYIFKKVVFVGDCLHFFALEASQRTPKPQKKGSKIDPKINKFWTFFGIKMGPNWDSKTTPKRKNKSTYFYMMSDKLVWLMPLESQFFDFFFSTFATHFGTPSRHQICPISNKMSPREPSGASKT